MPPEDLPYEFRFGPFLFHSQMDVPELAGVSGAGTLPVTIRRGVVPRALEGGESWGSHWINAPDEALFTVKETARYHVSHGAFVVVDVTEGAPPGDVSGYLLGVVFGILCHQNGMLPLHASALSTGGAVTALLGNSGAGKSTLAAFLERRGHRVVADDICLLTVSSGEVIPVAGWIKLWRESLEQLGKQVEARQQTFSDEDKYRVTLAQANAGRLRLRNVVLLNRAGETETVRLEPVAAAEAIAEMMNFTYVGFLPNLKGGFPRLFSQCAEALEGARCYRLRVPWGWDKIAETVELVERELLGFGG